MVNVATPSCKTCSYFEAPKQAPKDFDTSNDLQGVYAFGNCKRFPKPEKKSPSDWCGEHPSQRKAHR